MHFFPCRKLHKWKVTVRGSGKKRISIPLPKSVFPLKKTGFEVDLKEKRKQHRVWGVKAAKKEE